MACEIINSMAFDRYAAADGVIIIDLRNEEEYRKKHIKGAVNISADRLDEILERSRRMGQRTIRINDRICRQSDIILLYCSRGAQSFLMCRKMAMFGFNVKSLSGGIERYRGRYLTVR